MNKRGKTALLALFAVLGLLLGTTRGVMAFSPTAALPPYKEPPSARFDITGSMTIGTIAIQMTGSGSFSGQQVQEDITVTLPPELAPAGSPNSATTSLILIGSKAYYKVTGVPGQADQWYVMDLAQMGGMEGSLFGVPGTSVTGPNQQFTDAFTSTEAGKETINGAATTKYDVAVDAQKLLSMMGTPPSGDTAQVLANTKMMLQLWIGDADMYIYREHVRMDMQLPQSSSAAGSLTMDITVNFKDFGAPVTITAPPNAIPATSAPASSSGLFFGMPIGMPTGMMPTGMPTTGAADDTVPLAGLVVGLLLVAAGIELRRKALVQ